MSLNDYEVVRIGDLMMNLFDSNEVIKNLSNRLHDLLIPLDCLSLCWRPDERGSFLNEMSECMNEMSEEEECLNGCGYSVGVDEDKCSVDVKSEEECSTVNNPCSLTSMQFVEANGYDDIDGFVMVNHEHCERDLVVGEHVKYMNI